MRSFLVSCGLLLFLMIFLFVNAVTIASAAQRLTELCEALPSTLAECQSTKDLCERTDALLEFWDEYEGYVNFSVGHLHTEKIEDSICAMQSFAQTESFDNFIFYRSLCLEAIEKLKSAEGLSPKSFF